MPAEFVDATVFLGMNSTDERIRRTCTSFFNGRLDSTVAMSLEQVGRCDDVVWSYPRETQDAYYPFMDNLHTDLRFHRVGYDEHDLAAARESREAITVADRLLLAMVTNRDGTLYTYNPRLLALADARVRQPEPPTRGRVPFPDGLEALYQDSLALLVDVETLCSLE
jgi:Family of unknown function (DUF6190)